MTFYSHLYIYIYISLSIYIYIYIYIYVCVCVCVCVPCTHRPTLHQPMGPALACDQSPVQSPAPAPPIPPFLTPSPRATFQTFPTLTPTRRMGPAHSPAPGGGARCQLTSPQTSRSCRPSPLPPSPALPPPRRAPAFFPGACRRCWRAEWSAHPRV